MARARSRPQRLEDEIVAKFRNLRGATPPRGELAVGIGDDAALFRPRPGFEQILTCDWCLEGTHFLRTLDPPDAVGWKALARAVSDVAAMGGKARLFLLSLALPGALSGSWLERFLTGLARASRRLDCALAGGDTTRSRTVLIAVTVIGEIARGKAVLRSGARPGDAVYVSGRLGGAAAGLRRIRKAQGQLRVSDPAVSRHWYPVPRLELGQWLSSTGTATAGMDLSDGLSTDLRRLCASSGVGAAIELDRIPVAPAADLRMALDGGDDYELLFTVRPAKAKRLPGQMAGLALTRIGEITRSRKIVIRDGAHVRLLRPGGWDPFA